MLTNAFCVDDTLYMLQEKSRDLMQKILLRILDLETRYFNSCNVVVFLFGQLVLVDLAMNEIKSLIIVT